MRCFPRMLISNVHKSIIVMNSIDTRFSRNVFEAVQKTRSTCFIGSKTTRLRRPVTCGHFSYVLNLKCDHSNESNQVMPACCWAVYCAVQGLSYFETPEVRPSK